MNHFRWPHPTLLVAAAASLLAVAPVATGMSQARAAGRSGKRNARDAHKADGWMRGQALFSGAIPLTARIRGHDTPLPAAVVICANCHGPQSKDPSVKRAAPLLDQSFLVEGRSRRGGPPSAYDSLSFCRMLRTGVDPVSVLVAQEMPTYQLDDARCADLWGFLTEQQKAGEGSAPLAPVQTAPAKNKRPSPGDVAR